MNPQNLDGELTALNFMVKHALVASGTATFAGVDIRDFIGDIKLVLTALSPVGDGSTTATISLLQSADNTTFATWAAAPTFSPITATTGLASVSLDTRSCQRYIQAKHVVTGTTATFDIALVGVGIKQRL